MSDTRADADAHKVDKTPSKLWWFTKRFIVWILLLFSLYATIVITHIKTGQAFICRAGLATMEGIPNSPGSSILQIK